MRSKLVFLGFADFLPAYRSIQNDFRFFFKQTDRPSGMPFWNRAAGKLDEPSLCASVHFTSGIIRIHIPFIFRLTEEEAGNVSNQLTYNVHDRKVLYRSLVSLPIGTCLMIGPHYVGNREERQLGNTHIINLRATRSILCVDMQ